ncbi:MAG: T9SS type A sorting domain-containing protein [Bacteroidota bacterium]
MKKTTVYTLMLLFPLLGWSQWNQIGQNLLGDAAGDRFGVNVSISDDNAIIAVGAFDNDVNGTNAGQVKVFRYENGAWTQIGQSLYGDAAGDGFGRGVSVNSAGTILAVGANDGGGANGPESGHVKIYENINNTWTQIGQTIEGAANGDDFGFQISINDSGTIVAIGARFHDVIGFSDGEVRIFENVNNTWTQIGQDINGSASNDKLGSRVELSGDGSKVAISAITSNQSRGHVAIYENINNSWVKIGQNIDGEANGDISGQGLGFSNNGTIVAIGAANNDSNGSNSGHVRVFKFENGNWSQVGQELVGDSSGDNFGIDVALSDDGTILAVSAGGNGVFSTNTGYCKLYQLQNNSWVQVGATIPNNQSGDLSNFIALNASGSRIIIGTPSSDANGSDAGIVRVFGNALLSVAESSFTSKIALYPNPVVHTSTIDLGKRYDTVMMQIVNSNGQQVTQHTYTRMQNLTVDTTTFAPGMYIIHLISNKEKATVKMMKR